jgi:hypothetical protein
MIQPGNGSPENCETRIVEQRLWIISPKSLFAANKDHFRELSPRFLTAGARAPVGSCRRRDSIDAER